MTTSASTNITAFFGDRALFDALRDQVLPDLIDQARGRDNQLRVWCAGCATGEEVYALAILVAEALGPELEHFTVQIFGTALDEEAVAFARRSLYPAAALANLTPERIAGAFTLVDDTYQVVDRLRRLVIFGQHDLARQAPFLHLDLVLCRHELIHFTPELQTHALHLFTYALRDGGYLALGNADTPGPLAPYFASCDAPAHPELRLYRRQGERVAAQMPLRQDLTRLVPGRPPAAGHPAAGQCPSSLPEIPPRGSRGRRRAEPGRVQAGGPITSEHLGRLLLDLPLGVVIVDQHYDIRLINSAAVHLLGVYTSPIGEDLIHLTRCIPSDALRAVIDAAAQTPAAPSAASELASASPRWEAGGAAGVGPQDQGDQAVVTVETILGERRQLQVTCCPAAESRVLILLRDVTTTVEANTQAMQAAEREHIAHQAALTHEREELERKLAQVQQEREQVTTEVTRHRDINRTLLEANQVLADVSLALRTTNEALQVSQEETERLQVTNEEVEATNEELRTLYKDLQARSYTLEEMTRRRAAAEERERLARELHDTVIQQVFAASALAESLPQNWATHRTDAEQALELLPRLTRGAVANLRMLLLELRPSELEHMPLPALLRQLGEAMTVEAGAPITVQIEGIPEGEPWLPLETKVALYRAAQEALTNAARHAGARTITVSLRPRLPRGVVLAVVDDGQGFDPRAIPPGHFGLTLLRERAQTAGAAVRVRSRPGQGTAVVVVWKGEQMEGQKR